MVGKVADKEGFRDCFRRVIFALSAFIMSLCFGVGITSMAASAQISFTDPKATAGAEVNVVMKVKSEGDELLSRANIDLVYDPSVMEFVSGTDADGGAGLVKVHGGSIGGGTTTLTYNLRFRTMTVGLGGISIHSQEVYDMEEALVTISHLGSSTVGIVTDPVPSNITLLSTLMVAPGELVPAFSPDIIMYELNVGLDVNNLEVQALPAVEGASSVVEGNQALDVGENHVIIRVTAVDGSVQDYNIKVTKAEGGAGMDAINASGVQNEGVRLSAKEKSITIMTPGGDVAIPEGFVENHIEIDHHQVGGWVWKDDPNPKYCLVYGMNQAGELYFYRYDLEEKTIQRYFEDPVAENIKKKSSEYEGMYNALTEKYNTQFMLTICLGVTSLVLLLIVLILLLRKNKKNGSSGKGRSIDEKINYDNIPRASSSSDNIDNIKKIKDSEQEGKSAGESSGRLSKDRRRDRSDRDDNIDDIDEDSAAADSSNDSVSLGGDTRTVQSLKRRSEAKGKRDQNLDRVDRIGREERKGRDNRGERRDRRGREEIKPIKRKTFDEDIEDDIEEDYPEILKENERDYPYNGYSYDRDERDYSDEDERDYMDTRDSFDEWDDSDNSYINSRTRKSNRGFAKYSSGKEDMEDDFEIEEL